MDTLWQYLWLNGQRLDGAVETVATIYKYKELYCTKLTDTKHETYKWVSLKKEKQNLMWMMQHIIRWMNAVVNCARMTVKIKHIQDNIGKNVTSPNTMHKKDDTSWHVWKWIWNVECKKRFLSICWGQMSPDRDVTHLCQWMMSKSGHLLFIAAFGFWMDALVWQ